MKIIHVTPTYFSDSSVIGGGERYVSNICKATALHDSVKRSDILSFGPKEHLFRLSDKSDLRLAATEVEPLASGSDVVPASTLNSHLADYDVVHVHQCFTSFGLYVAAHAKLANKKVIGTDHGAGETPLFSPHPFLYHNFDAIHAASDFSAGATGDVPVKVVTIKGPVDDAAFALSSAPKDPRLVISIGRILPHKGFEDLIEALPQGLRLVVVGRIYDTDYHDFLRARISDRQVEFASSLDDAELLKLIRQASLCLHGSVAVDFRGRHHLKAELLGLTPLECMATGLPVICSRTAALSELGLMRGCVTYGDRAGLVSLLEKYVAGSLEFPPGEVIREDVILTYGLKQFSDRYFSMLAT